MERMKYLLILMCLSLAGCGTMFSSDDMKNYGGNSRVTIHEGGDITVETAQPDNPNSSAKQSITKTKDGTLTITQETGGAFKNAIGKLKGVFGMVKLYHIASILCLVLGLVIWRLPSHFSDNIGISLCLASGTLFAAGSILPDMGRYVAIAGCIGAVVGVWYIYHKHILHKAPPKI